MPIKEFECQACHHRFEEILGLTEPVPVKCPKCSGGPLKQLLGTFRIGGATRKSASEGEFDGGGEAPPDGGFGGGGDFGGGGEFGGGEDFGGEEPPAEAGDDNMAGLGGEPAGGDDDGGPADAGPHEED